MGNETKIQLRERGRGRKAFWIVVWAAVAVGIVYAFWTPRGEPPELSVATIDSALAIASEVWSELTPEQRDELVQYWNGRRSRGLR